MYKILNILFILLLAIPASLTILNIEIGAPLNGYFETVEKSTLSAEKWFNAQFQNQTDKYLKDQLSSRPFLVRLHNQLDFSIHKKVNSHTVILGKGNCLYEENYIKAYYGTDYIGYNKIKHTVEKISSIKQFLDASNTKLLIVYAPGKASFYPEYIPEQYKTKRDSSNFDIFKALSQEYQIPFLDLKTYFIDNKGQKEHPLYSFSGVHWSDYAVSLVADTLSKHIQQLFPEKKLPKYSYLVTEVKKEQSESDMDAELSLNLLSVLKNQELAYTEGNFDAQGRSKLKSIVVADSYYWQLFNAGFSNQFFNNGKFWYYNKQIYPDSYEKEIFVEDINAKHELQKTDLVILLATDANLYKFPFGFENTLETGVTNTKKRHVTEQEISELINYIKTDEVWYQAIKLKAEKTLISVDSMLYLDAKWELENQIQGYTEEDLLKTMEDIRKDTTWFNHIQEKALKNNIDIETQLKTDAEWVLSNPSK